MMKRDGYTISEAARVLDVSRFTLYKWIEKGRVQPVKTPTRLLIPHDQLANLRLGIQ